MTYEPKVGDEVVIRGEVTRVEPTSTGSMWTMVRLHGGANWTFLADMLEPSPAPDLGEAELRGQVTGPWAVALSEAMEKIETRLDALETVPSWAIDIGERLDALEASAKVRDVPATMVNLAHRVQSLEVTIKTLMDTMREREDATRAELDGALLRVGRLEEFAKPRASFVEKFPVADARAPVAQERAREAQIEYALSNLSNIFLMRPSPTSFDPASMVKWKADTGQFMFLSKGIDPNTERGYKIYRWTECAPDV